MTVSISTAVSNPPTDLPPNAAVVDFHLGNSVYARVILELVTENDHAVIYGQAYEVTSGGAFKTAPLGYPSRTPRTARTIPLSALGDTISVGDSWVRSVEAYDPTLGDLSVVTTKPNEPGPAYGYRVWDSNRLQVWKWTEGEKTSFARQKAEEMLNILNTSAVRSGLAFN